MPRGVYSCKLSGAGGTDHKGSARCAVPFFFMISGYFCYYEGKTAEDKIPSKILHIFKTFFSYRFCFILSGNIL